MNDNIEFEDGSDIGCESCGAEFTVYSSTGESEVYFCPFCGSELEGDEDTPVEDGLGNDSWD